MARFAFDASPARHLCAEFDALADAARTHADAHEDEPAPGGLANVREYLRALRMKVDDLARHFGEEAMVLALVIVAIVVLAEERARDIVS